MSNAIGSIFLDKSILAPATNPVASRIGRNTKNFNFSGVLALHERNLKAIEKIMKEAGLEPVVVTRASTA
jgi:hypothetical protein